MDYKYDLKGSTHKRAASERERSKSSPTYKDNDFVREWSKGIILPNEVYSALMKTIERDCRVLESFGIMDYRFVKKIKQQNSLTFKSNPNNNLTCIPYFTFSFLMGVHKVQPHEKDEHDRSSASSRTVSLAGSLHKRRNMKSFYKVIISKLL